MIVEDRQSRGNEVEWPEGVKPDQASKQADYPPEIWAQAASEWEKMPDAEQEDYRANLAELARQNIDAVFADISKESFLNSFSAMDLLFFGLAVVTAYKIAAPAEEAASPSEADSETNEEDEAPQE